MKFNLFLNNLLEDASTSTNLKYIYIKINKKFIIITK